VLRTPAVVLALVVPATGAHANRAGGVTSTSPAGDHRALCSKYAELYGPGVSTTMLPSAPPGVARGRRDRAQDLGEPGRVVVDAVDAGGVEHAREHPLADQAVLDDVRHARRGAQVVLQHAPGALGSR
jgi:hypothetical protein